jgi:hypothetical protein
VSEGCGFLTVLFCFFFPPTLAPCMVRLRCFECTCFGCVFDLNSCQCDDMHDLVQIIETILGEQKAPWEDPEISKELLRPLGIFKPGVLALVAWDPSQRSTIRTFRQACMRCLANTSITAT